MTNMAAPLSLRENIRFFRFFKDLVLKNRIITRDVSIKQSSRHSKFTIIHNFCLRHSKPIFVSGIAFVAAAAGVGGSSWLYLSSCDENNQKFLKLCKVFPAVKAAQVYVDDANLVGKSHSSVGVGDSRRSQFNFIADTVAIASPSVVFIDIQGRHPYTGRVQTVSNGSGFIVRTDGLILTNAHVVANKKNVRVTLPDGRKVDGSVQAIDPLTDLATVKIPVSGLPAMKLGDSSTVRSGEWVIAVGSPFALNNTVTAGIVSTVGRCSKELGMQFKDMEYIQTDAVINFGNSGGPLVNLDGEAIGINTMKVTTGISFAIPSVYAKEFLERAEKVEQRSKKTGWFASPTQQSPVSVSPKQRYMGVTMLTLTPSIILELQNRIDFPEVTQGVLIHKVVIGSPAFLGGIKPGDILTEINGVAVKSAKDVYKAINEYNELKMTVIREKQQVLLNIKPEEIE